MEGEDAAIGEAAPRCLLLGSGEFEPWVGPTELQALESSSGDGNVVILATASAPEGEATFGRWNEMGVTHFTSLGVPARALPVRSREDADNPEYAEAVSRASLTFFSGGNPEYLARSLEGTVLWRSLLESLARGAIYGGCSAGAMVAGTATRSGPAHGRFRFSGGLGLFPNDVFGVHWDSAFMRVLRPALIGRVPTGCRLIGIAERTAILTEKEGWRVSGEGIVEVREGPVRRSFAHGELIPNDPGTASH
jgi:cyanophycinase